MSTRAQAARAEEAADIALGSAKIAKDAAERVVDALPTPDPRDDVNFQRLAGVEESMLARLMPRRRNRWPKLFEFEQRLAEFDRRQEVLRAELTELRQQREESPERFALALAGWLERGENGERPSSDAEAPPANRGRSRRVALGPGLVGSRVHALGGDAVRRARALSTVRARRDRDVARGVSEDGQANRFATSGGCVMIAACGLGTHIFRSLRNNARGLRAGALIAVLGGLRAERRETP